MPLSTANPRKTLKVETIYRYLLGAVSLLLATGVWLPCVHLTVLTFRLAETKYMPYPLGTRHRMKDKQAGVSQRYHEARAPERKVAASSDTPGFRRPYEF